MAKRKTTTKIGYKIYELTDGGTLRIPKRFL